MAKENLIALLVACSLVIASAGCATTDMARMSYENRLKTASSAVSNK